MVKRSLQASPQGIQQAKRAFAIKGWTQENLAGEVNLKTRQPIWRFFTGQSVDRQIFVSVCSTLDLDWREIADNPPAEFRDFTTGVEVALLDLDGLVQQVRSQYRETIQNQCGTLQLLEISHPVGIDDIYVDVNILEDIASQQWFEIADLQTLGPADFDRVGLGAVNQKQIPGMSAVESYSKLRVLGKPGVGKTTFLQHLAIQCNRGGFAAHQVPIFITLRDFAETAKEAGQVNLLSYIHQAFLAGGMANQAELEMLLQAGRALVLLDGMDEVPNEDSKVILKEIHRFSDKYYKNQFVASCRTAAQLYRLRGFTDVEIAPLSQTQIITFAQKWFAALNKTMSSPASDLSAQFMQTLDLPENRQLRQLVTTPLFLNLACWVFHRQEKFPAKRAEFYKQGLDLLLGKWDDAKGIGRENGFQQFRLSQKLRLLSQLAAVTFEQGHYFFERRVIEQHIGDYLQTLPGATVQPEELQLESEAMLDAIAADHGLLTERAHGIFSFSYLAFHEYFTARNIVTTHTPQALESAINGLVSHLTDPRWHEIVVLTTTMLRSADPLMQLIKQQVDGLVAQDPYLQRFLVWVSQKALSDIKPARVGRFGLMLARVPDSVADGALAYTLDQDMALDSALNDLLVTCAIDQSPDRARAHRCRDALSHILNRVLDTGFHKALQQLRDQLPYPEQRQARFQVWWQAHHTTWMEQLRQITADYRSIHPLWLFSDEQQHVLQRYYDANQLLIDCLNSNCDMTTAVRQEIEATLLRPQTHLEDRE